MIGQRLQTIAVSALSAVLLAPAPVASAATLTEITNFGSNPAYLRMHLHWRVHRRPPDRDPQ